MIVAQRISEAEERPAVEIVEVSPRDGFQSIGPFIPTRRKFAFVQALHAAGLRRIEIGSFANSVSVPQLTDTPEILSACNDIRDLRPQVLVATARRGRQAVTAGAKALVFVLSVSEPHNCANVSRGSLESVDEYRALLDAVNDDIAIRLDVATAFDCPYNGIVAAEETIGLLDRLVPLRPGSEICLCDTTGRATPDQVEQLFDACTARYADTTTWAFHAHDTYGLGAANVLAAYRQNVRIFDASAGGIGGCPFAPGAAGNVATEDLAWMFAHMGIHTGIDMDRLLVVAGQAAELDGGVAGGRVRAALSAKRSAAAAFTGGNAELSFAPDKNL